MHYFIDGYNLLFKTLGSLKDLQTKRQKVIALLEENLSILGLPCTIVFDRAHLRGEESGFQYLEALQVVFSPKGQSADEYIIEVLS